METNNVTLAIEANLPLNFSASGAVFYSLPKAGKVNLKVITIGADFLQFSDGWILESVHESDCCESHYLSFEHFTLKDFEGHIFDLSNDKFFEKVPDYGIRLIPLNNHEIPVPGYGYNNGYYSTNLVLRVTDNEGKLTEYDITECQVIEE
jgi:hypothetical protein